MACRALFFLVSRAKAEGDDKIKEEREQYISLHIKTDHDSREKEEQRRIKEEGRRMKRSEENKAFRKLMFIALLLPSLCSVCVPVVTTPSLPPSPAPARRREKRKTSS